MTDSIDERDTLRAGHAELLKAFERAFNARNDAQLKEFFEPDALLVPTAGQAVPVAESASMDGDDAWKHQLPITLTLRYAYTVRDTALIIVDYVHEGTGPDGRPARFTGTAADVLRLGDDGTWRCLISNPAGTDRA